MRPIDPTVSYLVACAREREERGEREGARALLEVAHQIEEQGALACSRGVEAGVGAARPDVEKLARELYQTAVDHALGPEDAHQDAAVDAMIRRLDDVLLGIRLGRRHP
jgi:hypothetical protein